MEKEIWKDVVGYEGLYKISSLGRVYSMPRFGYDSMGRRKTRAGHVMKIRIGTQTGYPMVNLTKDGASQPKNIHRLIAEAFIPNPNHLPCVNHKDENRSNSILSNLEWCTYKYNNNYGKARDKRAKKLKEYYETHNSPNLGHRGSSFDIIKYDLQGNRLETVQGGLPALEAREGRSLTSIASCLCHKNKTAYGFVWRYEGDPFSYVPPKNNTGKKFPKSIKSHQKQVIKKDLQGNVLGTYNSVSKAAKANGFDRHCLSRNRQDYYVINDFVYIVEKKENEYIPKGHKGPRPDLKGKGGKPVIRISSNGEEVQFNSISSAAEAIGNRKYVPDIVNACKGNLKTAHGFKWRYADT